MKGFFIKLNELYRTSSEFTIKSHCFNNGQICLNIDTGNDMIE